MRAAHWLIAAALAEIRKQIRDEVQSKRSHRRNSRLTCLRVSGDRCGDAVGFSLSERRRCKGRRRAERAGVIPGPSNCDFSGDSRMRASLIQHGEPRRFVMSAPIPLRRDFGASHLRGLAKKTKDGPQARRLLALAAIYDGGSRTEAAKIGGVGFRWCATGCWISTRGPGRSPETARRRATVPAQRRPAPGWRGSSRAVRSRRSTGWCAGG